MKIRITDSKKMVRAMRLVKDDSRGKAVKTLLMMLLDERVN